MGKNEYILFNTLSGSSLLIDGELKDYLEGGEKGLARLNDGMLRSLEELGAVVGKMVDERSGDAPFDLQVPAGHGLYGLVVERASLVRHLREQHHAQWPLDWADLPSVQALGVPQRLRLAGLVREVLASLQAQPAVLQQPASRRALHEALIGLLADTLVPEAVHTLGHPRQQRRHELVRRVRELVMSQAHEAPTVDQLCSRLHVTRRTLQNSFQEALGMSPGVYLRTIRLNAVRRALREEGAGHTIADTAARWGFWHMGHFSQEYKALFGETPTQTRQSALAH
jgi:AraC family ethanolamine operon transcriptional activator